jgi:hydroxymethylpyrimidine/phosphomethylpyrimidine kinase
MPFCLSIAGSDPSGAAGLQADLKTFHQLGVVGSAVVTAVTYQGSAGVAGWDALDPTMVSRQLEAVASLEKIDACKTGMLGTAGIAHATASFLGSRNIPFVLDPVIRSTSGHSLLDPAAMEPLRDQLLPLATIVTPNAPEAAALTGHAVTDLDSMIQVAETLVRVLGARAALVTGGHNAGDEIVDVLFDGQVHIARHPRLDTTHVRGTGCTLSAAIAAWLARGASIRQAVAAASEFVRSAIASAPTRERGRGPVNHLLAATKLPRA